MQRAQQLKFDLSAEEIESVSNVEKEKLHATINQIAALRDTAATFENTVLKLDHASAEFSNVLTPVMFLKYISVDEKVRGAADKVETSVQQMFVDIFVREDLFLAIKAAQKHSKNIKPEETKLLDEYLVGFKRNGLELPAEKRATFIEKKKQLVLIEAEYNNNLTKETEFVEFSKEDLAGLPENYVASLEKTPSGKYKVTLSYPHYFPFMDNATNAEARKTLEFRFHNRGGAKNKQLLEQALGLREELAKMLGYANHASFVLERRMAKAPEEVDRFLKSLSTKLIQKGKKELGELSALKVKHTGDSKDPEIHAWDWRYYDNHLKKSKYQVDNEKVREYFPLDTVVAGLFDIYQTILGVRFVEEKNVPVWHPTVRKFRIERSGKAVAYFFMDLFPREGKYGHAAAFTLIGGYKKTDGTYELPCSSIVANFNPPAATTPSLLEHSEVETLFHEFGHIMHQVLTQARFSTFAGTNVKTDFVEAPSQMLENWVWNKEALTKLSGHYKNPSEKLPDELIQKLLALKHVNTGIRYLRQLSFATLDMEFHTKSKVNTTEVYARIMKDLMQIPIQENTLPQASFGHLMGGYDAGYYSYLWAEVYAQDLFTRFQSEGLLNPKTGADYVKWILEPGGEKEPDQLISGFLGRAPNSEAFLKEIGI